MGNKIRQIIVNVKKLCSSDGKNRINPIWAGLSIVCMLIVIGGIIWFVSSTIKKEMAQRSFEELSNSMQQVIVEEPSSEEMVDVEPIESKPQNTPEVTAAVEEKVVVDPYEKVVDILSLQESVESNIYAWIYIPGTMIDYPILQHDSDNTYYLNHNLDGSTGYPGCIYTENYNSRDLSNPNTVIYGHNMKNGTMFADVHKFMNAEYAKEHPYVYIYMSDKMYIYEVYAAYEYGNEHLLAGKDMSSSRIFKEYLDSAKVTASDNGYYNSSVSVTEENKIITLSTCITGQNEKRVLLQAVLTN